MKKFESNVQFQGSAQSRGFKPVTEPDFLPAQLRQIEAESRNQERTLQANLLNERMKANYSKQNAAALKNFSKTLQEGLQLGGEMTVAIDENRALTAYLTAKENSDPDAQEAWREANKRMEEDGITTQNELFKYQQAGLPADLLQGMNSLGAHGKAKYARLAIQDLLGEYQQGLLNAIGTKEYQTVEEARADINDYEDQFSAYYNLRGKFSDGALIEYWKNPILKLHEKSVIGIRKGIVERTSQENLRVLDQDLAFQKNPTTYVTGVALETVDGKALGRDGAWKRLAATAKNLVTIGHWTPQDVLALLNEPDPQNPKKTIAEHREKGLYAQGLMKEVNDIYREITSNNLKDRKQASQIAEQASIDQIYQTAKEKGTLPTLVDLVEARKLHRQTHPGQPTTQYDRLIEAANKSLGADEAELAVLDQKILDGVADETDLRGLSLSQYITYTDRLTKMNARNAETNKYKKEVKRARALVSQNPRVRFTKDGKLGFIGLGMADQAERLFYEQLRDVQSKDPEDELTPTEEAELALSQTQAIIEKGFDTEGSQFYLTKTGEAPYLDMSQKEALQATRALNDQYRVLDEAIENNGLDILNRQKLFGSENYWKWFRGNYGKDTFKPSPAMERLQKKYGFHMLEFAIPQMEQFNVPVPAEYRRTIEQHKAQPSSVRRAQLVPNNEKGYYQNLRANGTISQFPVRRVGLQVPVTPPPAGRVAATELPARTRALLRTIRYAEGTLGVDGYRTMFTFAKFDDYGKHPELLQRGGGISSDAAGGYQFLSTTWKPLAKRLGLTDFSPRSQDLGAVALLRELGVNPEQLLTRQMIDKLAPTWASFPTLKTGTSYYGQGGKTFDQLLTFYKKALNEERDYPSVDSDGNVI